MNQVTVLVGILTILASSSRAVKTPSVHVGDSFDIENRLIRIVVRLEEDGYHESYFAKKGNRWVLLLESGSAMRPDLEIRQDATTQAVQMKDASVDASEAKDKIIRLGGNIADGTVTKTIHLRDQQPFVRVEVAYKIGIENKLTHLLSTYSFSPDGKAYQTYQHLDFIYTPQLRPRPEHLIAEHTFRSPALIMQKDRNFVALVPDLQSIDQKNRAIRSVADLQVETTDRPFFSFGLQNWQPEPYRLHNTHVFYSSADSLSASLSDTTVSYGFFLFLDGSAQPHRAFEQVVRYHWDANGERYFNQPKGPQTEPFSSYIHKAWYEFLPQVVLDAQYQGKPITLLRQGRLAWSNNLPKSADDDCWFNVWFNSLRTAYGMYLYGREAGDQQLMARAEGVLNLALLAPQKNGIAPTIFYVDSSGGHWVADQAWGGIANGQYYPMFHNAWTNYWMLRWADLVPKRRREILRYTKAFAGFLLAHQQASGVIPSWYDPETLEPVPILRDENAETAGACYFLSEFYARTKEKKYLAAAEKGMRYIFAEVVPREKWFDYETFFSCSRKPVDFYDTYTQQFPQNTLSMQQAAEACYALYELTGRKEYKEKGVEIIDYLCLYQQVWSPKWLSAELFGGFGVQNTDAEWSDARQGYCAVTLMNYYELTGSKEYFERGVAALRAMFSLFESPTSPRTAENYGHSGLDKPAGVTGLHWGTGSSVVSIHLITERYGDAYVNVKQGWGVGIDGCRFTNVSVERDTIRLDLADNVSSPRKIRVKFDRIPKSQYVLIANNNRLGTFWKRALEKGLEIAL